MAEEDWPNNYFNYFTEIEEHFRRARGTGLFLLSPLDWALIDTWRTAGVPLEAVLRGIDDAFEKWRSRKTKRRLINSLAYCAQAVLEASQRMSSGSIRRQAAECAFALEEIRAHLNTAVVAVRQSGIEGLEGVASSLQKLSESAEDYVTKLEDLERRLTALEDKTVAVLKASQTESELYSTREQLERELKPYRGKMTSEQLAMLERRYLDTALLERAKLPRFSIFYIR